MSYFPQIKLAMSRYKVMSNISPHSPNPFPIISLLFSMTYLCLLIRLLCQESLCAPFSSTRNELTLFSWQLNLETYVPEAKFAYKKEKCFWSDAKTAKFVSHHVSGAAKAGETRDTKTLNLSRNIVSLQVLVDVLRFSPCLFNLTRNKKHFLWVEEIRPADWLIC